MPVPVKSNATSANAHQAQVLSAAKAKANYRVASLAAVPAAKSIGRRGQHSTSLASAIAQLPPAPPSDYRPEGLMKFPADHRDNMYPPWRRAGASVPQQFPTLMDPRDGAVGYQAKERLSGDGGAEERCYGGMVVEHAAPSGNTAFHQESYASLAPSAQGILTNHPSNAPCGAGRPARHQHFFNSNWPPSPGRMPPPPAFNRNKENANYAQPEMRMDGYGGLAMYAPPNHKWPPSPGGLPPVPGFIKARNPPNDGNMHGGTQFASGRASDGIPSPSTVSSASVGSSFDTEMEQGPLRAEYAPPAWIQEQRRRSRVYGEDHRAPVLRAQAQAAMEARQANAISQNQDHGPQYAQISNEPIGMVDPAASHVPPAPRALNEHEQAIVRPVVGPGGLVDWVSEMVWAYSGIDTVTNVSPGLLPWFKSRVNYILSTTGTSNAGVITAMCYLARLPCAEVDPSSLSDKEKRFQYELGLFDRVTNTNVKDKNIGDSMLRLFVLVLMLSNKWLEDNTYTNKTWNDISGFTCASLRELEAAALACMEHNLVVSSEEWLAWLQHLRSLQVHVLSPGKAVGGEKENAGMHRRALDVLDGLIWQAGQGGMSVGLGLPSHAVQSPAVEADCSYDDQSSLDLDADGPLRDDYKPNAKVALGRSASLNGQTARTHHPRQASLDGRVQRGLPTPAQWNPSTAAFDSPQPPSRPRPQYEAIQRPVINAYCASGQDQMPQAPLIPHVVPGHFYYGQQQQNPSNAPGQQHPYAHAYPMQQTYRPEMCMPAGYGPSNPSYQPAANEQAPANSSWYNWQGMWSCPQESSFGMQAGRMGTSVVGAAVANFGARLRAF